MKFQLIVWTIKQNRVDTTGMPTHKQWTLLKLMILKYIISIAHGNACFTYSNVIKQLSKLKTSCSEFNTKLYCHHHSSNNTVYLLLNVNNFHRFGSNENVNIFCKYFHMNNLAVCFHVPVVHGFVHLLQIYDRFFRNPNVCPLLYGHLFRLHT